MTEKEISKLTRKELVELLLSVTRENDRLKDDVERLAKELKLRKIAIETSGTMAEAAMKLNRVFEAADAAAKQYLQNVKARADAVETVESDETNESHHSHEATKKQNTHSSHITDPGHGSQEHHEHHTEHENHDGQTHEAVSHEPRLVMPEDEPKFDSDENPFSVSEESVEN